MAAVGFIVIAYLTGYEIKSSGEKRKQVFLSGLAEKTLNGEFPEDLFKKFEIVVKYGDEIKNTDHISDAEVLAILEWLKKGAFDHDWTIQVTTCEKCGGEATRLVNRKGRPLELCKNCLSQREGHLESSNDA